MDGKIFLYHVAKWGRSDPQCLNYRLDVKDLCMGVKSDQGICALGEHLRNAENLANSSANSLPAIPVWSSTHRNLISVPDSVKQYEKASDSDYERKNLGFENCRRESLKTRK